MEQEILFDKIKKIGIVPVVKLEDVQDAKPLDKSIMIEWGITMVQQVDISYRTGSRCY